MKSHAIRALLVALFGILALVAAPVAAKTTPFKSTYDATTYSAVCGIDAEIRDVGEVIGRFSPDRVDVTNAGVTTITNLANDLSVTQTYQILFKNSNTVDLGGGLISGDQTTVGPWTLRGPDGSVLLRQHGPVSSHLVINLLATTDDEFLVSQEVYFEHGSHADEETYCAAVTGAIG